MFKNRTRKCLIVIVFIVKSSVLQAVVPNLDLIDSITAVTLPKASYDISLTIYAEGSLLTKALIGLHDNFYLGVSFDAGSVIGHKEIKPNIPGVVAKIKFTDGWDSFPLLIAMGYDSFYTGNNGKVEGDPNPFDRVIYGPYFAFSKTDLSFWFRTTYSHRSKNASSAQLFAGGYGHVYWH